MADGVPTIIRTVFRCLSLCAPKTAGNLAFTLFCRPPDARKITPVQSSLRDIATPLLEKAQRRSVYLRDDGGGVFNISTYVFEPEADHLPTSDHTTLLVHGWSSRATHMLAFVQPLLDLGHKVVAVDLPAHGESSGRLFHVPLGVRALHAVSTQVCSWNSIIAHSLGGTVTSALVDGTIRDCEPMVPKRLVLISTPNCIPQIFADFSEMIGLNTKGHATLCSKAEQIAGSPLGAFVTQRQVQDAGVPTLVIHDHDDREIPVSEATAIAGDNPAAELYPVNGHGHRRILYAEDVVKQAVAFCTGTIQECS
ncbi:MAG: alpha/beta hydrolase [Gammaproteobacteria bacterium]|nr:alpha/beta hydrolase [Gammaproteobacteria bacterium]